MRDSAHLHRAYSNPVPYAARGLRRRRVRVRGARDILRRSLPKKAEGTRTTIQEIKARQVGPVGDESHELRPAELVKLPLVPMSGGLADSVATVVSPAAAPEQQIPPSAGDQT